VTDRALRLAGKHKSCEWRPLALTPCGVPKQVLVLREEQPTQIGSSTQKHVIGFSLPAILLRGKDINAPET
jgi:hypothetical protein